jgi:hypothetical protein
LLQSTVLIYKDNDVQKLHHKLKKGIKTSKEEISQIGIAD